MGMERVTCKQCGEQFIAPEAEERKFCSRKCYGLSRRKRLTKTCEFCGQEFEIIQARKDTAQYCSKSCRAKAQWAEGRMYVFPSGEDHPGYQGPQTVECWTCGKEFEVSAGYYNNAKKRKQERFYCSKDCFSKGRSERYNGRILAPRISVTCSFCGEEFEVTQACHERELKQGQQNWYCSIECKHPGPVTAICDWCGEEFEMSRRYYNSRQKNGYENGPFCSRACMQEWQSEVLVGPDSSNWRGGTSFEPYDPGFDNALRQAIRKRDKHKCRLCGKTQKDNIAEFNRKLSVHHIDYSKDNHSPNNLISLCHTCHCKTNGNREHFEKLFSEMLIQ